MVHQVLGSLLNSFNGPNGAVGPDFHHKTFVVGNLANPSTLDIVVDLPHRTEHCIDRQNTHGRVGYAVRLHRRLVTHALLDIKFNRKMGVI